MASNSNPSSILASQHDTAKLMSSFQNLGLGDRRVTSLNNNFEVDSSSLCLYPDNLWAYHRSINGGCDYEPSYLQSGSGNFARNTHDGSSNYLGYDPITSRRTPLPSYPNHGSPSTYAQTLFSSYPNHESASTTNSSDHLWGASLCDDQSLKSITRTKIYLSKEGPGWNSYNLQIIQEQSNGLVVDPFPKGVNMVSLAKLCTGAHILPKLLGVGDDGIRKWILVQLLDSLPELMTHPQGHHVFQKLICSCNDNEFHIIVHKLTSKDKFLLDASFNIQGSYSVQKLIKRIKKSPMASSVTYILSTRFFEMMTHPLARHVIKQCLNVLGLLPNMVLYEAAIVNCSTLAVHSVGCVSINDCIDFITGPQRDTLLQRLADQSAYLANDPSGNYVVQHVLKTRNPLIVDRVCHSLRGHYRELSTKKGGSHVVEMCVMYSSLGMNLAVQEFLENSKALVQLAKDPFGNYVIQTMLKVTKLENIQWYEALVEALKRHFWFLERYKTGRSVLTLIERILISSKETSLDKNKLLFEERG